MNCTYIVCSQGSGKNTSDEGASNNMLENSERLLIFIFFPASKEDDLRSVFDHQIPTDHIPCCIKAELSYLYILYSESITQCVMI